MLVYTKRLAFGLSIVMACLAASGDGFAALMNMQVGDSRTYEMSHGTLKWDATLDVVGEATFGSNTYFEFLQSNYTPGVNRTLYFRSTETEIFAWNGSSEVTLFKTGAVGDRWSVDGEVDRVITGVNVEVTVPYGTFVAYEYEAYRDSQNSGMDPYQRHYITPELGFIQEIDWWDSDENNSQIQALSQFKPVPIPGAALLMATGLVGLVGLRRKRQTEYREE